MVQDPRDKLRKSISSLPSKPAHNSPVWQGPEKDGITFSLLSRFMVCRERFRVQVVEGLRPVDSFNHRIQYGSMWHVCEEAWAKGKPSEHNVARAVRGEQALQRPWEAPLADYCRSLCKQYPTQQDQIAHWYEVCRVQFPVYVQYWSKHPDVKDRTPLLQEEVFEVPYRLPSGRIVKLRGKWDSVDLIQEGKSQGIYLQENKTKGDIVEQQLKRQLTFDLQTMLYLTALTQDTGVELLEQAKGVVGDAGAGTLRFSTPILGVRYNVVRRPLSGGRHSIVQHKPSKSNPMGETRAQYYGRLKGLIEGEPDYFFMRWKVLIYPQDIEKFKKQTLDPILEQLCDWWGWMQVNGFGERDESVKLNCPGDRLRIVHSSIHWRHPFGVYNVLDEGGSSDLDEYLATGSELGLERSNNLFPELT